MSSRIWKIIVREWNALKRKVIMKNPRVEIYQGRLGPQKGKWRARVIARNGKIIVETSEGYVNRGDAEAAIKLAAAIISEECPDWQAFRP